MAARIALRNKLYSCSFTAFKRKNRRPAFRLISCRTEAATNSASVDVGRSVNVAVCLERLPIITANKNDLERQFEALQDVLEIEHSSLSDYELMKTEMLNKREQLKRDEDNEKLKKEVALLDSEYQELKEIELQQIKDPTFASRTTEADKNNDRKSPSRKLDQTLYMLVSSPEEPERWKLPQGCLNPGETLREGAERVVKECLHNDLAVRFMSNAPSGVLRQPERDGCDPDNPKVFFYQAQLLGAVYKYGEEMWSSVIWASRNELAEYLPSSIYQSVLKFLL